MRILFSLITLLFTACSFIVGIIWVIAKTLGQVTFHVDSKAWNNTLNKLRNQLQASSVGTLVPWDGEMLSLLSLNRRIVKQPGWFGNITEGVFTSIYQEPVVAYAELKSGNNTILLARTSDRELVFRRKDQETEIWMNGQPLGIFTGDELRAPGNKNQLLAQLEREPGGAQYPVTLGDQTAAAINNPALPSRSPNPRALTLLRDLEPEEEGTLLALTMLKVLESR